MKRATGLLTALFVITLSVMVNGQADTIADSINPIDSLNQRLTEFTDQLKRNEQQRLADSIRRLELQRELDLVKASDYMRRRELQDRLFQLEKQDSIRLEQKKRRVEEIRNTNAGIPVAPFGDTLFLIYNKIGAFTPLERSESISRRIKLLYKNRPFYPDSILIVRTDNTEDLIYRDRIIMSVSDIDALINGIEPMKLAQQYKLAISQAVAAHIKYSSLSNIFRRVGFVLLTIGIVALLIFLTSRLFRFFKKYIRTHKAKFTRSFRFRNYEFLSKAKVLKGVLWLNNVVKIFFYVLIIYIALPFLFSIFPVTESWAGTLLNWVIDPVISIVLAFIQYLPDLITVIVIVVIVRYLVKLMKYLAKEVQIGKLTLPGFHPDYAMPTFGVIRFVLYAFMFVVIFPYLPGSDSDIFKGVSVFLGILISLGSSSAISNIIAGLVITYMRPFKLGDRIKIGEISGDVIEKTPLVIRVRTIKNEEITIPNSQILTSHTINYSNSGKDDGLILHTTITIGYDVPWKQVHELLISAAKGAKGVSKDKEPFVLQTSLDDFSVAYEINVYTVKPEAAALIYSSLHEHIQDAFNKAGVEIMSPNYNAIRDGNALAMPPKKESKKEGK